MYENFIPSNSLKNLRLHSMVMQARWTVEGGYWENGKTILALFKKILPLAKQEGEWYLYLETFEHLMLYEVAFGKERPVIQYSQVFFREYKAHFEEAFFEYPDNELCHKIIQCFQTISQVYEKYAQIDDRKLERFWEYFYEALGRCGHDFLYWTCRLEFALYHCDLEMAKEAKRELERRRVDYNGNCYACINRNVIGFYFMMDEIEKAEEIVHKILFKEVPKEARWMYDICRRSKPEGLYAEILDYSIRVCNPKAFAHFLPLYMDVWHAKNGKSEFTYESFRRAAAGDFTGLSEDLAIASDDAENYHTFSGWVAMENMISWTAYFKKLERYGKKKVKIASEAEGFPIPDSKGCCSLKELALWYEKKADEIGAQFEKSRKRFHYQTLKKSHFACCGLMDLS